jgi:hypothetical protein
VSGISYFYKGNAKVTRCKSFYSTLYIASTSNALLSVLLVCNAKNMLFAVPGAKVPYVSNVQEADFKLTWRRSHLLSW